MPPVATIIGAEQFSDYLNALDAKVAKKYTKAALQAGADVLRAEMVSLAPVKSGALRNSIKARFGRSKSGMMRVSVGLRKAGFLGKGWYGAAEEFGWMAGFVKQGISAIVRRLLKGRTKEPGKHFVERAGESVGDAAGQTVVDKLASLMDKDS